MEDAEDDIGKTDLTHNDGDRGCCRPPDALIAEANANAEFLIGLDGSPDDDALESLQLIERK